jgi:hypothetical protein
VGVVAVWEVSSRRLRDVLFVCMKAVWNGFGVLVDVVRVEVVVVERVDPRFGSIRHHLIKR